MWRIYIENMFPRGVGMTRRLDESGSTPHKVGVVHKR